MNWITPSNFLWALPLGGAIVALYLLRMRRKELRVPATFLWPQRTDEVRANSLFQKLKFNWLMVLQLLAVLALVAAIAQPQLQRSGIGGQTTVVVIDASASMGATDGDPTRFDTARGLVDDVLATANPGDRVAVIEAGPIPRVVVPMTSDPQGSRSQLEDLRRVDAETDVGEALRMASALISQFESGRILLVTDGTFEPVENFTSGDAEFSYVRVGSSSDNLAIEALGAGDAGDGQAVYVGVRNHGLAPNSGTLTLTADDATLDSVNFDVEPDSVFGHTVQLPAGVSVVEARIESEDDVLASDDYAGTVVDPNASVRVLLVSPGNPFIERALAIDPRVTLDAAADVPPSAAPDAETREYDVVVFDGIPPQPVNARGVLSFGDPGGSDFANDRGEVDAPTFALASEHPIVQDVPFAEVYVDRGRLLEPLGTTQVVAEWREGPAVLVQDGAQRRVHLAFQSLESDFPLTIGFPILLSNTVDWLVGEATATSLSVRSGTPFAVRTDAPVEVADPAGEQQTVEPIDGRALVRTVDRVGRHVLTVDGAERTVVASLRSPVESSVAPQAAIEIAGENLAESTDLTRLSDVWKPLLILALLVLAGEWWLFARRS